MWCYYSIVTLTLSKICCVFIRYFISLYVRKLLLPSFQWAGRQGAGGKIQSVATGRWRGPCLISWCEAPDTGTEDSDCVDNKVPSDREGAEGGSYPPGTCSVINSWPRIMHISIWCNANSRRWLGSSYYQVFLTSTAIVNDSCNQVSHCCVKENRFR